MNDSDIFAPPRGYEAVSEPDADIFAPPPQESSKEEVRAEKPGRTFSQYVGERLPQAFSNIGRGLLARGPLGMAAAGVAEGNQTISDAIEKSAYNAGGYITDVTGSPLAGYLTNVGVQAAPTIMSGYAAQKLGSPAMESSARRIMQAAVKPTWEAQRTGKAAKAIDTLLEEGVNPTQGGVQKLRGMVQQLNDDIAADIAKSPATVNKAEVGKVMKDRVDQLLKQVNPDGDISAFKNAWMEFRNHPLLAGKTDIPVQLAQEMKQGTYASLGSKPYGEMQGAATEAQKTLARGLKEGIAKAVPSVAEKNARESKLLNAMEVAERRAMMGGNNQLVGLGWLVNSPLALPLWLAERSPYIGGLMARAMYSGRGTLPVAAGAGGAGAYMAQQGVAPGETPMLDLTTLGALYR